MTVLYLSGPMTGLPDWGFPAFTEAAAQLRAARYAVLNPAENFGGATDLDRARYLRLDIQQVLAADGVATLPGWTGSRGAQLEVQIARALELPVAPVAAWLTSLVSA